MEQNWKDFLLEHYTQVSEHLRESDRKRDILFAVYSAFVAGILSFVYSTDKLDLTPKLILLGFLIIFGIGLALYTTFARAWHCEYTRVAKAIHKSFFSAELNLYKAANEIKEQEKKKHRAYFNPTGTEFIMMVLILLFIYAESFLIIFELTHTHSPLLIILGVAFFPLIFGMGLGSYSHYLDKKENDFPDNSWCIVFEEDKKMDKGDLEEIKTRLTNIENKLDKSQKFGWASSFYLLGITGFAIGIGWIIHNPSSLGGWLLVLVGLIVSIIGVASLLRYGWFSKR